MSQATVCGSCGSEQTMTPRPLTLSGKVIVVIDRVIYRVARRWLFLINSISFAFVMTLFLAPAFVASGHDALARPIYGFNSFFCHQLADRSFSVFGEKMACCQRCAAIYGSILIVGLIFALLRARIARPRISDLLMLSMPMLVDGGAQLLGLWESTALTRVITGSMFGMAICWILLPYLESGFARIRLQIEKLFDRLVQEGRAQPLRS